MNPHRDGWTEADEAGVKESRGVAGVLLVTASIVLLIQVGAGGELALLPLLVTTHLHLSAAGAGPRYWWWTCWEECCRSRVGALRIAGAAIRALGAALIWAAANAWIAESMPRRRHALFRGLFGEFENVGVTIGPMLGGLAWSVAGIQSAFYTYAATALLAAVIAAVTVDRRAPSPVGPPSAAT
jgi:hypothetical protein